jgi:hypothetical protein
MKMPRFTAEASLYKVREFYQSTANHYGDASGKSADSNAVVQPQLRKTDYECVHDCLEAGGGDMCNFFCTENVDEGGGGGGGQSCRPECGPCYDDPDSPTGRTRTCIRADCETYDRQCQGRRIIMSPRSALPQWA